ncbi:hypothetical protein H6P81_010237 [Aristolochia fimbriata]|uniref:RNase H type-1 domain-containing protein n=1 Tax=Aristolochia fimbriata TaxID=158543 RepID=A0AAV7ERJ2_ARIFI|nr:hypothetical protein H6P81_010237 [Aristolochia fimbriata]
MAVEMKLLQLNIYGDSALVIKQLTRGFKVKKLKLVPFWKHAGELLAQILEASLHYVPRSENGPADALAGIAASLVQFDERPSRVPICERWVIPPLLEEEIEDEQTEEIKESLPISASQNEAKDWREPISNFLRHDILPVDLRERVQIRRAAPRLARNSTYKLKGWAITGRRCSGTPPKWLKPVNRANSMLITYTSHRCRFTRRSYHGRQSSGDGHHRSYHS